LNAILNRTNSVVLLIVCGLSLQSCDDQSSSLSINQNQDGIQANLSIPNNLANTRLSPERLEVAVTLDDSAPVILERQGENWVGNFPFTSENTTRLGVTWFSGNVHLATMTRQIDMSEDNPSETFFPNDYVYLDSDSDQVMNIDEVAANSDPFDETVWPDTITVANNNTNTGLLGTTGLREKIDIIQDIVEVDENSATVRFTLSRVGTATLPIRIRYRPSARTASQETDYNSSTGLLEWPVGSFDIQIAEIELQQDIHIEPDEYFVVSFTNEDDPENTNVFADRNSAIAIIKNSGGTYEVSANDTSRMERIEGWYDASSDKYGVNVNARVEIMPSGEYKVYRIVGDCYQVSSHSIETLQSAYIFEPALFVVDGGYYRVFNINAELEFNRLSDHTYDGTNDMTWPRIGELGDQLLVDGEPCTE